jgi:hypothetical protein
MALYLAPVALALYHRDTVRAAARRVEERCEKVEEMMRESDERLARLEGKFEVSIGEIKEAL